VGVLSDEGLDDQTWWANILRGEPDPALDVPDHVWDTALGAALDAGVHCHEDLIPADAAAADDENIDGAGYWWSDWSDDVADQVGGGACWSEDYATPDDDAGFD
jgi:hypothetical protein